MQYVHTIRYLKPVQIYNRLRPRRRRIELSRDGFYGLRPIPAAWTTHIARHGSRTGPQRFSFLNEEREIATWNDAEIPKLWLYNLHYFDSPEFELIERWIAENSAGTGNGWEPYPLSRRIVNWIKYALTGGVLSARAQVSLATQAAALSRMLEYGLLANHLFANAKALVFAGAFFEGQHADEWLTKGLRILETELREQVLPDGGHIERSPMYHALILEDLLDLINLERCYALPSSKWSDIASRMLSWLSQMLHPDGEISFFNDSAIGIAPEPVQLQQYASRLSIPLSTQQLGESGYVRLEQAETVVVFDAAPIGPDYQPGHAHADTLSFELSHCGRRVIVNSGTSTYEKGPERLRQRSTAAHSTIRVDGRDQSEVWDGFRVARRARPFGLVTDRKSYVEACHTGYQRLPSPVVHRRRLQISADQAVITDTLEGHGKHTIELFWHIHPDAEVEITMKPDIEVTQEASMYHPQFGVSIPNRCIRGKWSGQCPKTVKTVLALS